MSLSSLIHSLAMCQISDPLIDNHAFVCCQLGKLIPPPSDPSTTQHANHVQTGSQIPELFFNCYDNRAKCWLMQTDFNDKPVLALAAVGLRTMSLSR